MKNITENTFYKLLLRKTSLPILSILGASLLYVIVMTFINHPSYPFPYLILILAVVKTIIISMTTLKQLSKLVTSCYAIEHLLWIFGLLIFISMLSFATDYTCLYQFDHSAFEGAPEYVQSYLYNLYHFFYFSLITFSTVGYGDISPVSEIARFIVMLEIFLSFFIVVFAFANIKKMHINE